MTGRRFSVVLTPDLLARVGCPHSDQRHPSCRPCDVSELLLWALTIDHLAFDWTPLWDGSRRLHGEVRGIQGQIALTELLALAQEHPRPQSLAGWHTALARQIEREERDGSLA